MPTSAILFDSAWIERVDNADDNEDGDDEDENNDGEGDSDHHDDQGKIAEILPDEDPIQAETNEERSDTVEEESPATDAHCNDGEDAEAAGDLILKNPRTTTTMTIDQSI